MLGYGYWGRNVAKALQNSSDFELKAIFDLDKSQQDAANTAHHLSTTYKDIQSILEDDSIHSIFIITPPQSHYPLAKLALESIITTPSFQYNSLLMYLQCFLQVV